ncbi:MAG TPA: TldD/PmbA family protein [archaeon]|nr:TldD/PmbA family protein [archaeon]
MLDLTEQIVKKALSLGASDAVAEITKDKTHQIRFANSDITVMQNWHQVSAEIFIALQKKVVSTSISDLSKDSIENTLKNLVSAAKVSEPSSTYKGLAEGPFKYKSVEESYDRRIADLGDKAIDFVYSAINAANAKRVAGVLYSSSWERFLSTSAGINASEKGTDIEMSTRAFNEKDESGHGVACSRLLNRFNPESAGEKAGEIAKLARKPIAADAGKYDVIFDPLSFADLLNCAGRAASAFDVDAGFSCLAGMLGKKVANFRLSLYDESNASNGFGSVAFDDEGVPTQKTAIIKDGVLKNYLHNTSTAAKYSTRTTGNAGLVAPYPRNIVMDAGGYSKDELFDEVRNGIYITNVWYTRFQNYRDGSFSTIPRDGIFLIQSGQIIKSLKGIRVSDNLLRILQEIAAISRERDWIHWWEVEIPTLAPYALVKDVNITKSTM